MENSPPPANSPTNKPSRHEGRGCLFYGCLVSGVLVLVTVTGLALLFLHGLKKARTFLDDFVDTKPLILPAVSNTPAEMALLDQRVTAFIDALNAGTNTQPLVLNSTEVNAWMQKSAASEAVNGHAYFSIDSNRITAQASIPLEKIPMMNLSNKFLNGVVNLNVAMTNGHLLVSVASFEVKGKPLPDNIMVMFQSQNLAQDFQDDQDVREAVANLESVEVIDGKLIFKAKAKSPTNK